MDQASREAYAVAKALGVTFMPSLGITADEMPDSEQYALDLLDAVLARFSKPTTRVAVLQDWDKGRRAELDAFSGYVVKKGERNRHADSGEPGDSGLGRAHRIWRPHAVLGQQRPTAGCRPGVSQAQCG
jgi:hypothetical protein